MHTTSPIRRYVIVRRRGDEASASRWSMERVAPTPIDETTAQPAAPRPGAAGVRPA